LEFEKQYRDIGCEVCQVGGAATKIPVGSVSGARLCHEHKMAAATNSFYLPKNTGLIKPEVFYTTFDCYCLKSVSSV
jgi:hypothetical protein